MLKVTDINSSTKNPQQFDKSTTSPQQIHTKIEVMELEPNGVREYS